MVMVVNKHPSSIKNEKTKRGKHPSSIMRIEGVCEKFSQVKVSISICLRNNF